MDTLHHLSHRCSPHMAVHFSAARAFHFIHFYTVFIFQCNSFISVDFNEVLEFLFIEYSPLIFVNLNALHSSIYSMQSEHFHSFQCSLCISIKLVHFHWFQWGRIFIHLNVTSRFSLSHYSPLNSVHFNGRAHYRSFQCNQRIAVHFKTFKACLFHSFQCSARITIHFNAVLSFPLISMQSGHFHLFQCNPRICVHINAVPKFSFMSMQFTHIRQIASKVT